MRVSPKQLHYLLQLAVLAVLLAVLTHTRADPDLFGSIRFGHDVIASGSAQVDDRYSFTSGRTFTNHEWLFQAVAFLVYSWSGAPGLILLKLILLAAMLAAVMRVVRAAEMPAPTQLLLAGIVVVGTFPQTNHVRAQLCSLALFAWLIVTLTEGRRCPAVHWWQVPLMIVWANVHGGWLVGAGTIAVWSAAGLVAHRSRRAAVIGAAAGIAATTATMVNPWGWHLWGFLQETVGFGRADIADWQPVFRLGLAYGLLWTIVALVALAASVRAQRRRQLDLQASAIALMLAIGSFRVNRLLAFFTIAVAMLLAPDIAALLERASAERTRRDSSRVATAAAAVMGFVLIFGGGAMAAGNLACIRMESKMFPEPDVASLVARYGLHGRMMNWFDYGHYAIWYFSAALKVSMDGRRETVYSSGTIERQLRFYFAPAGREALLAELQPDYIWLPRHVAVVNPLIAYGWKPLFEGPQSVVLAKHEIPGGPIEMSAASRCFPGP